MGEVEPVNPLQKGYEYLLEQHMVPKKKDLRKLKQGIISLIALIPSHLSMGKESEST